MNVNGELFSLMRNLALKEVDFDSSHKFEINGNTIFNLLEYKGNVSIFFKTALHVSKIFCDINNLEHVNPETVILKMYEDDPWLNVNELLMHVIKDPSLYQEFEELME